MNRGPLLNKSLRPVSKSKHKRSRIVTLHRQKLHLYEQLVQSLGQYGSAPKNDNYMQVLGRRLGRLFLVGVS